MVREKANGHAKKGGREQGWGEGMNLGAFKCPAFGAGGGVTVRKLLGGCPSQISDVFC